MSGSSDTIRSTQPVPCATSSRPRRYRYETVCLRIGRSRCWMSVRLVTTPWLTKNFAGGSLATYGSESTALEGWWGGSPRRLPGRHDNGRIVADPEGSGPVAIARFPAPGCTPDDPCHVPTARVLVAGSTILP